MTDSLAYIRGGHSAIRPYICGPLDLPDFLRHVFDAVEIESHAHDSTRRHVQMGVADSVVVVEAGRFPEGATPWTSVIYLYVPDADETFARAIAAGATIKAPMEDKFYNERQGGFVDSGGNTWWVSTFKG
ncbi:MAG TPA: VOC family protein [Phycisphaerae bacterium]|nr:VOC family protein [Phycisphaerae bacterium]HRW53172.1 VOC family protein [Phycisphaerae bacterium]